MAPQRRAGRVRGKSDPMDALAVARRALGEPRLDDSRSPQVHSTAPSGSTGSHGVSPATSRRCSCRSHASSSAVAAASPARSWRSTASSKNGRARPHRACSRCLAAARSALRSCSARSNGSKQTPSPHDTPASPLEASSGKHRRHRLDRGGNRQLNCALHRIAITRARVYPPARAYLARTQAEGKSRREALRCLKRQLARTVYTSLKNEPP